LKLQSLKDQFEGFLENTDDRSFYLKKSEFIANEYSKKIVSLKQWESKLLQTTSGCETDQSSNKASGKIFQLFTQRKLKAYLEKKFRNVSEMCVGVDGRLRNLVKKLEEYEKLAYDRSKDFIKDKEFLEDMEMRLLELNCEKDSEIYRIHKEEGFLGSLQHETRAKQQELQETRNYYEGRVYARVEDLFLKYSEGKITISDNFENFYGARACGYLKNHQKRDFVATILSQQRGKFDSYKKVYQRQDEISERLKKNIDYCESVLVKELKRLYEVSSNIKSEVETMKEQQKN
jgi:hypothetical protein